MDRRDPYILISFSYDIVYLNFLRMTMISDPESQDYLYGMDLARTRIEYVLYLKLVNILRYTSKTTGYTRK